MLAGGAGLLLGIAAILYSIQLKQEKELFFQKYDRTYGRVLEYRQDSLGRDYPVVIFISEDSQRVHIPLYGKSTKTYEIGDPVEVYYDLINPTDAGLARSSSFMIWFAALSGGAIIFFTLAWVGLMLYKRQQKESLKRNGRRIRAQVQSVGHDPQVRIKGKPAYIIHCQWEKGDQKGTYYTFQSEPLAEDPTPRLKREVDVYIDFKNPENYWVDTSFL